MVLTQNKKERTEVLSFSLETFFNSTATHTLSLIHISPLALLPVIASLIGMLPFFQSKETVIKIAAIISDSLWLIYTIAVHSYSGALTNVLLIVTTFGSLLVGRKRDNAK